MAGIKNLTNTRLHHFYKKLILNAQFAFECNAFQSKQHITSSFHEKNVSNTYSKAWAFTSVGLCISIAHYTQRRQSIFNSPVFCAANFSDSSHISRNGKGYRFNFNFIADVVEKVAPTVVYIEIKDTRSELHKKDGDQEGYNTVCGMILIMSRRFNFFTGAPATASNGSGFIVREDGLILTSAHVVLGKPHNQVEVRLHGGTTYIGEVEDVDFKSDLATVRIHCKNLPVMNLGVSDEVRPGEFVVALGSPLALSNTITVGVVSSVNRPSEELGLRGKDMDYIQTDASITFGNSGGPLVNLDGEAIGINSMKVTAGISFAVPIDYAKEFLLRSEKRKEVEGKSGVKIKKVYYLGVTMLTLTPEILYELQVRNQPVPPDVTHGVFIWKVVPGSPAQVSGLQQGDIVTHINEKPIKGAPDVYEALDKGATLKITVARRSKQFNIDVTPETM